jgi:hypothetical protein
LVGLREEFGGIDVIGEDIMQQTLRKYFAGFERHLQDLKDVPPEFRMVDPNVPMKKFLSHIGRLAVKPQLNLVPAIIATPSLDFESSNYEDLVA